MKAIFVHDNRFLKNGTNYYFSAGFDEEFYKRYLNIFGEFSIFAREGSIDETFPEETAVSAGIGFLTLKGYSDLISKETRKKAKEYLASADCLIIRLPSILGLYAVHLARKMHKPYLIEVVGCAWEGLWYQKIDKKIFAPFNLLLTKLAIRNSRFVVYVTSHFLQSRYPSKGKSISCSNVTLFEVKEEDLIHRIEKIKNYNKAEKTIIGTCGVVDVVYKGQQYILKAIAKLKEDGYSIEYHLAGGGNPAHLKKLAQELDIEENVIFLGELDHEDVFNWMGTIDIYVHPSDTEGLPRAVIEAMSKGCPVIGSNAGGIPELIEQDFVFPKGDVDEFCSIFKRLSCDLMITQAYRNHEKSKQFLRAALYKRRESFFKRFMEEIETIK